MAYINTPKFKTVFSSADDLVSGFQGTIYYTLFEDQCPEEKYIKLTYALLSAKYDESHIATYDVVSFQDKVYSIIFQFAPAWSRQMDIQKALRGLSEEDLRSGGVQKVTSGYNPSTVPGTANSDTEIETVNAQNLSKRTKSKADAYAGLLALLDTDLTEAYIRRFSKLFMTVIDTDDILIEIAAQNAEEGD